jgi:hypothetical protein
VCVELRWSIPQSFIHLLVRMGFVLTVEESGSGLAKVDLFAFRRRRFVLFRLTRAGKRSRTPHPPTYKGNILRAASINLSNSRVPLALPLSISFDAANTSIKQRSCGTRRRRLRPNRSAFCFTFAPRITQERGTAKLCDCACLFD